MNLFDLYAQIILDTDDYEQGLDDAGKKTSSFADKLKRGLTTAAQVGAAAIGTASAGIAALTKSSIAGYADYEQLVGGVETLFKDSADTVQAYAANAYKTAGLSANQYMETVTSFSASLLQSLGGDTAEAAQKADLAITDMSDNANKMGTSMESIQNAYQGFAKANYTMLDNLKLGYGGTKEEMQRLLEDAEAISGIEYDISSYADVVDAIHVIQTEMGITGTTAKEANSTIAGSISAMKSAWDNLVVGIADDNAEIDLLIDNFVESVGIAGENIIPRVEKIITGIGELVEKMAPIIGEKIPEIVAQVLPLIINAGMQLIQGLVKGVSENLPAVVESAIETIETLADAIIEMLPEIIKLGMTLIVTLAESLIEHLPDLVVKIPEIIKAVVDGFADNMPNIIEIGTNIVEGVWEGIKAMADWIKNNIADFFGGIVDGAKNALGIHSPSRVFAGIGENMALGLGEGWDDQYDKINRKITDGMDFGTANIDVSASAMGKTFSAITGGSVGTSLLDGVTIVVQSVLDGRVIGETSYQYIQGKARAYGT